MISINNCRVTPDRKYLEFNVETLSNYKFSHLYIWKYTDDNIWEITPSTTDLESLLDKINNKEVKQLSFNDNGLGESSLYYLTFVVEWDGTGEENSEAVLTANAVVVDLNQHFFTKIRLISTLDTEPTSLDKLLNIHIYESCLKSSITLERWEDANYFYGLLLSLMKNNIISII